MQILWNSLREAAGRDWGSGPIPEKSWWIVRLSGDNNGQRCSRENIYDATGPIGLYTWYLIQYIQNACMLHMQHKHVSDNIQDSNLYMGKIKEISTHVCIDMHAQQQHTVSWPACMSEATRLRHTAPDAFQSTRLEEWEQRLHLIPRKASFHFNFLSHQQRGKWIGMHTVSDT